MTIIFKIEVYLLMNDEIQLFKSKKYQEKIKFLQINILNWYKKNGRNFPWRKKISWQKALITELLLQRTQADHVLNMYEKFFEQFPDLQAVCEVPIESIEKIIYSLGFQKIRAKRLKTIAISLKNEKRIPSVNKLKEINGIGDYIANAVHCFQYSRCLPLFDTNFGRVYSRYFNWVLPKDFRLKPGIQKIGLLILPLKNCPQFNYGILDLASSICKPKKPNCKKCPVKLKCSYNKNTQKFTK